MEEENFRERCAEFIVSIAAPLVAAGDETRAGAIKVAVNHLRQSREADNDPTGTLEVENQAPQPSRKVSDAQIREIARELMDAARDAADNI